MMQVASPEEMKVGQVPTSHKKAAILMSLRFSFSELQALSMSSSYY